MSTYIPKALRQEIRLADNGHCSYCQTSEANSGIPLSLDHILPQSKGGQTNFENLCQACRACNEFKGDITEAIDLLTGQSVPIFNPRVQNWNDHFAWSLDGVQINGLISIGRATVVALQMNNPTIVPARRRWVAAGWHPPA